MSLCIGRSSSYLKCFFLWNGLVYFRYYWKIDGVRGMFDVGFFYFVWIIVYCVLLSLVKIIGKRIRGFCLRD